MTPCRCAASCCDHRIDLLCIQAQASKPRSERTRPSALAEPPAGIERVRMITSALAIERFYQILIRLIGLVDKRCQRCRRWIAINDAVHRFSLAAARAACCRLSSSPDTAMNALPRLKLSSSRTGDNQARIDRFDWLVASQAVESAATHTDAPLRGVAAAHPHRFRAVAEPRRWSKRRPSCLASPVTCCQV